jgi:transposase-like protein
MRYRAVEKLEIIRLVEQSPLPVRHTLVKLGIPRATFYRWYDRYSRGGASSLATDRSGKTREKDAENRSNSRAALKDLPADQPRNL